MVIIGTNFDPGVGLVVGIDFHLCVFGRGILNSEPPALAKSLLACLSVPSIYPANALLHESSDQLGTYGDPDAMQQYNYCHFCMTLILKRNLL
jgi:hypothetical protein